MKTMVAAAVLDVAQSNLADRIADTAYQVTASSKRICQSIRNA